MFKLKYNHSCILLPYIAQDGCKAPHITTDRKYISFLEAYPSNGLCRFQFYMKANLTSFPIPHTIYFARLYMCT